MRAKRGWMKPGIVLIAISIGAVVAQAERTLILNGKVASHDIRVIEGRPYVPLADVARALGQAVVKRSGGYEIRATGGANQVEGLQGKIGDVLFDGEWRFEVLRVNRVDSYAMKNKATNDYAIYNTTAEFSDGVFRPKQGQSLVAIACRVKNGLRDQNQALWRPNSDTHTALADDQGQSYPPIAYDMPESGPFQSKALLPGAAMEFTVLFTVPDGATLKDLVFTLRTISSPGHDVRVSLTR
jgi:hypothetical protein